MTHEKAIQPALQLVALDIIRFLLRINRLDQWQLQEAHLHFKQWRKAPAGAPGRTAPRGLYRPVFLPADSYHSEKVNRVLIIFFTGFL